jgi:hypothetical protein
MGHLASSNPEQADKAAPQGLPECNVDLVHSCWRYFRRLAVEALIDFHVPFSFEFSPALTRLSLRGGQSSSRASCLIIWVQTELWLLALHNRRWQIRADIRLTMSALTRRLFEFWSNTAS